MIILEKVLNFDKGGGTLEALEIVRFFKIVESNMK